MGTIVFYLFIIAVVMVVRIAKQGSGKSSGKTTYSSYTTTGRKASSGSRAVDQTAARLRDEAQRRMKEMQYRSTHADEGYDEKMLDYCDSELSTTHGITFREMPAGMDELVYLRRYNHRREKELENALHRQDRSATVSE